MKDRYMRVLLNIKKAGSRRYAFAKVPYEIPFGSPTLKDILCPCEYAGIGKQR